MSLENYYNRLRSSLIYAETSLELLAGALERVANAPDAEKIRDIANRIWTVRDNVLRLSDIRPVVPYETVKPTNPMVLDPEERG